MKISGILEGTTKESVEIAYSVAKNVLKRYDPENDFFEQNNVHITIPHKTDGGSAGTAMVSLFLSLALNLPIRGITMSGGISRKEMVLEVGDVKYKLDAAKALGIQHVILPQANKEEFDELEGFIRGH